MLRVLLGILVTAVMAMTTGIILTLILQLTGTFIAFLVSGVIGGYLAGFDRFRGFVAGLLGSIATIIIGLIIIVIMVSFSLESVDLIRYMANYTIWLILAPSFNILPIIVSLAGLGGIFGQIIKEKRKKKGEQIYTGM